MASGKKQKSEWIWEFLNTNMIIIYQSEIQDWTIPKDVCKIIKDHMVNLMINTPTIIQKQIVDCLELISMTDFPTEWPEILPVNKNIEQKISREILTLIRNLFKKQEHVSQKKNIKEQLIY